MFLRYNMKRAERPMLLSGKTETTLGTAAKTVKQGFTKTEKTDDRVYEYTTAGCGSFAFRQ